MEEQSFSPAQSGGVPMVEIHDRAEQNWREAEIKAKTIGHFARHLADRGNQREMLNKYE